MAMYPPLAIVASATLHEGYARVAQKLTRCPRIFSLVASPPLLALMVFQAQPPVRGTEAHRSTFGASMARRAVSNPSCVREIVLDGQADGFASMRFQG